MAALGGLHPGPARAEPPPRRQPARADAEMAILNARDVYTRRNEGVSIWVVRSADITASSPSDEGPALRAGELQGLPPPDLLRDP